MSYKVIKLAVIGMVLLTAGCAGTVKTFNAEGEKTGSIPAKVAIMAASAETHSKCPAPEKYVPVPMGDICTPKDDACQNKQALIGVANAFAKMEHQEEQSENQDKNCHAQVASETKAYFKSEETKYKQVGNAGQTLFRWIGGYFVVDSVMGASSQPAGDTNVETLNVNGSNVAGAGAEGAGGATGGVTQNVNIGPGTLTNAQDGAVVVDGEKPIIGDGNTMDDSGDGSNNNPGFFN